MPAHPVDHDPALMRASLRLGADRDTGGSLASLPREPVFGAGTLGHAPWADRIDALPCTYTTSGRAAILLALRCLGVGAGDRVLLPTYHCPTMVEPAVRLGAQPLFYPIDAAGLPDLDWLHRLARGTAKAILAAHYFGLPRDFTALRAWCDASGTALVEDCAHAFFGRSPAGPVGSLGDLAIGSLPKFFPTVEGGCLSSRRFALPSLRAPSTAAELRSTWDVLEIAVDHGRRDVVGRLAAGLVGLKRRLRGQRHSATATAPSDPDLAAACHTIDLDHAGQRAGRFTTWLVRHCDATRIVAQRRANFGLYAELFDGAARLRPLTATLADGAVPYVFPLEAVDGADTLYRRLRERGVPLFRWDLVWPGTPATPGDVGARWSRSLFQLACHQDLSTPDIRRIARVVRDEAGSADS